MRNVKQVVDSPDRPNVKLSVELFASNEELSTCFSWLFRQLTEQKEHCDRTVVFCRTISDTSSLYATFKDNMPPELHKHFNMYHSMTLDTIKVAIRDDMAASDGQIRILFATNAAGMGVNFEDTHQVVHFGVPTDMDTYVQQLGRAGRSNSSQGHSLILYSRKQLRTVDAEMLSYVKDMESCRRSYVAQSYQATSSSEQLGHLCCDNCAIDCTCSDNCPLMAHPYVDLASDDESEGSQSEQKQRLVTDSQKHRLHCELMAYRHTLEMEDRKPLLDIPGMWGLSKENIANIVVKAPYIFGPEDLLGTCDIPSYSAACDIMKCFYNVFDDFENDESHQSPEDNVDGVCDW